MLNERVLPFNWYALMQLLHFSSLELQAAKTAAILSTESHVVHNGNPLYSKMGSGLELIRVSILCLSYYTSTLFASVVISNDNCSQCWLLFL